MSDLESKLRTLFDVPPSDVPPERRIQHLGAFWPHWNLHKRKCDTTGRDIISIFRPDCPYPVWHKDVWYRDAQPPQAQFDFEKPFFPQAEKLFKSCPIAHNTGTLNENCEYTDDWWKSKNCYLCHSGVYCEDDQYGYRILSVKNSSFAVFSFESEWCVDIINCEKCFRCVYGLYLHQCQEVKFSYDCRGCHDCLFCFNLRNKSYCIGNKQLSKEEYVRQSKQFSYDTLEGYTHCKNIFRKMMREMAWYRAQFVDHCENSSGNFITHAKDSEHLFFGNYSEDCYNSGRQGWIKTALDCIGLQEAEKIYLSCMIQIKSYDVQYSYMLESARFTQYSGYCSKTENCFGCCGLLNGKNCIMNTSYSVEEYSSLKQKIVDHMKSTGEWGQFFPGAFAPNPYDESWSSFYFPLSPEAQKEAGYLYLPNLEKRQTAHVDIGSLPHTALEASEATTKLTFWDDIAEKPFQILPQDINFCRNLGVVLPHNYYMRRIRENFSWMPFPNLSLRTTHCAKSGKEIQTSWPSEYDGRILSEEEYLKIIN